MATTSRSRHRRHRSVAPDVATRTWTVLAQDPSVSGSDGRALTTQVRVPAERLEAGPKGHRIHVVDYDCTRSVYQEPRSTNPHTDPYARTTDIEKLVSDPHFHQQNAYGIAMGVLSSFQKALGRPVAWGFDVPSHQLKIAPHAFAEANAYYSRESESLSFGYFRGRRSPRVFTCLSHDIVAHETAHAVLDGLRRYFMRPSHLDQDAFHEGFADVVALLSVLQSAELIEACLAKRAPASALIESKALTAASLKKQEFFGLAEQYGLEDGSVRGDALRRSVRLEKSPRWLLAAEYEEPHRRGEILVAAMAQAFLEVWCKRLEPLGTDRGLDLNRAVVAEEAATAAGQLLVIAIRALDYLPPVDLTFSDYLSALLTADMQLFPDDSKYHYRGILRKSFVGFGIEPASRVGSDGVWEPPERAASLRYEGLHFEQLRSDGDTLFRFLWENRRALELDRDAFTRVTAVRPAVRVSADGLVLRETVVEYVQTLRVYARELHRFEIDKPRGLAGDQLVALHGGGTLLFDEFGRLKFHIGTGVTSRRQSDRLQSLHKRGALDREAGERTRFAELHRRRMLGGAVHPKEQW